MKRSADILFIPVAIAIAVLVASLAWGHDTEIIKCDRNLKVAHVNKLGERLNANGTVSEAYDRNSDGRIDIEAISHVVAVKRDGDAAIVEHAEHPFLYIVDLDFDGVEDMVYVDKSGLGRCEDIVLYRDLTVPHQDEAEGGRT